MRARIILGLGRAVNIHFLLLVTLRDLRGRPTLSHIGILGSPCIAVTAKSAFDVVHPMLPAGFAFVASLRFVSLATEILMLGWFANLF